MNECEKCKAMLFGGNTKCAICGFESGGGLAAPSAMAASAAPPTQRTSARKSGDGLTGLQKGLLLAGVLLLPVLAIAAMTLVGGQDEPNGVAFGDESEKGDEETVRNGPPPPALGSTDARFCNDPAPIEGAPPYLASEPLSSHVFAEHDYFRRFKPDTSDLESTVVGSDAVVPLVTCLRATAPAEVQKTCSGYDGGHTLSVLSTVWNVEIYAAATGELLATQGTIEPPLAPCPGGVLIMNGVAQDEESRVNEPALAIAFNRFVDPIGAAFVDYVAEFCGATGPAPTNYPTGDTAETTYAQWYLSPKTGEWSDIGVPETLEPQESEFPGRIACLQVSGEISTVGTCSFDGGIEVEVRSADYELAVYDALTGEAVLREIIGSGSGECPLIWQDATGENILGPSPDLETSDRMLEELAGVVSASESDSADS